MTPILKSDIVKVVFDVQKELSVFEEINVIISSQ
jgi:hypothetical protein